MKKIYALHVFVLLFGLGLASCVDKAYDLGKIDSDGISIGDDESEFRIPVATVRIKTREIVSGDDAADVSSLIGNVNVWLPASLPGGADYLDLTRLNEAAYMDALFDGLYAEMGDPSTGKLDAVTDFVWLYCREEFLSPLSLDRSVTEELFKSTFRAMYALDAVRAEARRQAEHYLSGLVGIAPMSYELGSLGIESDVVDMLSDNLDPAGTPDPVNTLSLYGTIDCRLPLTFGLDASFAATDIAFTTDIVAGRDGNPVEEVRIYAEDLRTLADGTSIELPVTLQRYYPGMSFSQDPAAVQLSLSLSLVKRGSLKFEF